MFTLRINPERKVVGQSIAALALFFAAGVACISGSDKAAVSPNASLGATNATITGNVGTGGGLSALSFDTVTGQATLAGVRVATDRGDYSTTTDASGNFSLQVAGNKTYNLYATFNGYKTVVMNAVRVTIGENKNVSLKFTQLLAAGERTYVGSSQCKLCHAAQYNRWIDAAHRFSMSAPGDSPGMLSTPKSQFEAGYDLAVTSGWAAYGANAPKLSFAGDTYVVTIGNIAYPVLYILGWQWKQNFLTRIGDATYILPIQFNVANGQWTAFSATNWYAGTTPIYSSSATLETDIYKKNSWERRCMACHSVTGILSLEYSASPRTGILQHRADWLEKGIGCEVCHGPGSAHVWANGAIGDPSNPNITNPSKLSADRRNDVCGQCHSRGLSVGKLAGRDADPNNTTDDTFSLGFYYDGTRTFRPGDTLVDFFTDSGIYWNDSAEVRSSKINRQQWNDFYQSAHTAPGAVLSVTCVSCHDPHGPVGNPRQLLLSADDNSLCLNCHGPNGSAKQRFATSAAVTQHTGDSHTSYDPGGSGAGRCITCHMPYTGNRALNYDVRSHTFRIIRPHNSYRMAAANQSETMPNSCQQSCHNGIGGGGNLGTGTASALDASHNYDTTVERPQMVMPESGIAKVTGTITVAGAASFADTFGVWVSADFTSRATVTNRTGFYYLALDAPGTYTIRAMKPGYDSAGAVVQVLPGQKFTLNLTLSANPAALFVEHPYRCGACHGAIWGAEWRRSGFAGSQLSEAEASTELASGHGLMQNSPSTSCGPKCHEARGAAVYLLTGDTTQALQFTATDTNIGNASRRSQTCQVCHNPHGGNAPDEWMGLKQFRTVGFDTGYLYAKNANGGTYGSMPFPAPYKATICIMCHNGRTAPTDSGTGIRQTSGESRPVSTPHVGSNSEPFFGYRDSVTSAAINFDSFPGFVPKNSTHSDTNWGRLYSFQAYLYKNGAPKLVSVKGSPVVKSDSFTCVSCHMYNAAFGTISDGTYAPEDGGHTWKPDIRSCGVCHDPVYVSLNPYSNPLKAGSGDVGYWGTGSWGVSSSGSVLGFDRSVKALPHQTDNHGTTANSGPDGVFNDYDGDGVAEGAHTEAHHLWMRVLAAMTNGAGNDTTNFLTSGIGATGTDSFGHMWFGAYPYWRFNSTQASINNVKADEMRVAWNLIFGDHDETNIGIHNLRFAIETLRASWTVLGRIKTGNPAWVPPGDDY